jgi:hypothetical protein
MAVAVAILARDVSSLKRAIVQLTFSGTYTTGGETPSPSFLKALSFSKVHLAKFTQVDLGVAAGLIAQYDHVNHKVVLFETAGTVDLPLKELSSGASLTSVVMRAEFVGEGNN